MLFLKKEFLLNLLIGLCLACLAQPLVVKAPGEVYVGIEIIEPDNTFLGWRIITAYSSCPEETDDTPFVTASNQRVRKGIIATNELPFGTKVVIEGLGEFEVQDRTNSRYGYRVDIWMSSKAEALNFGRQTREIYVLR